MAIRPTPRPIRRTVVKGHSIIRNPGTGALIERLREPTKHGPIGFHSLLKNSIDAFNDQAGKGKP